MNYLRGALGAAAQYYRDINPSTLTGAIDVIVVRRKEDGGDDLLACTPFHVRFGKWQVLRPQDKKVKVLVNGKDIPFGMKIGDAGEAFFVFETDEDVPEDLITSPILEATEPRETNVGVSAGRFGAKESSAAVDGNGVPDPRTPEKTLNINEPEPFDLDSSSAPPVLEESGHAQPISSQQQQSTASSSSDRSSYSPSSILERAGALGKAVVQAAVEKEREERERIDDSLNAARNIASSAYGSASASLRGIGKDKGDEALPRVNSDEGQPPAVIFGDGIALDMAGYHGANSSSSSSRPGSRRRVSRRSSRETIKEELDYDSYEGPSTPRSGDISQDAASTKTPDTSRSPSPDGSDDPDYKKSLNAFRASSEPPVFERELDAPSYQWDWGSFPQPSPLKAEFTTTRVDGHAHDTHRSISVPRHHDTDSTSLQPTPNRARTNTTAYPSPPSTPTSTEHSSSLFGECADLTADENNGRRFLVTIGDRTYEFFLSICELTNGADEFEDARRFKEGQVSFRRFIKFPAVIQDKNLVIRWNDKYITREDGSALMDCLEDWRQAALAKPKHARALEEEEPLSSSDEREPETVRAVPKKTSSWVRWWRSSRTEPQTPAEPAVPDYQRGRETDIKNVHLSPPRPSIMPSSSVPISLDDDASTIVFPSMKSLQNTSVREIGQSRSRSTSVVDRKHFAKTLRLTSDQLKQLDLKPGMNSMTFSLSASGDAACTASIFLWDDTDSIVVSDIDGTITKSDALGHVFTMIGRDWTHIGVAKLYTDICRNGYKIMYLTSRAIGQADSTRYYLKGIKQNNYQLPEGPVIMSPDRLMASFHREVIMRKPEIFKMAALRDINSLFGSNKTPFYAGFGNRITDALSYRSVNIPSQRIFTIDSAGEVKMELLEVAGYKSSYIHLTDLVDQWFPPIHQKHESGFTDFNYWKTPIQEFELPELSPPSPALSATSETSTFSRLRNFSLRGGTPQPSLLPSPATQGQRRGGGNGREGVLRSMTSLERLSRRHTRSVSSLRMDPEEELEGLGLGVDRVDLNGSGIGDEEAQWERRARKRLSMDSMPGSLSGSQADFEDFDDEDDGEDEGEDDGDDEGGGEEGRGNHRRHHHHHDGGDGLEGHDGYEEGSRDDPEEAAEEGFDDDLLATGEMESVPFL